MPQKTRTQRADTVRLERLRLRLNQEAVAAQVGCNQATVSKAEQGRGSDEFYDAIERALAELAASPSKTEAR